MTGVSRRSSWLPVIRQEGIVEDRADLGIEDIRSADYLPRYWKAAVASSSTFVSLVKSCGLRRA